MKFNVFYSDGRTPRHETTLEAPDHRVAAEQFVSMRPVETDRRINVEMQGGDYSIQQFRPSDFKINSLKPRPTDLIENTSSKSEASLGRDDLGRIAVKRYRDGYLASRILDQAGGFIKISTGVLGVLIVIGFIAVGGGNTESVVIGLAAGVIFAIQGFILGMFLSAFAQLMKAVFDNTVHTSPFLDTDQKSDAMSLR